METDVPALPATTTLLLPCPSHMWPHTDHPTQTKEAGCAPPPPLGFSTCKPSLMMGKIVARGQAWQQGRPASLTVTVLWALAPWRSSQSVLTWMWSLCQPGQLLPPGSWESCYLFRLCFYVTSKGTKQETHNTHTHNTLHICILVPSPDACRSLV